MTRIAVTGGSGKLGRAVVQDLQEHGYEVTNIDTATPPPEQGARWRRIDLTDYGQVVETLTATLDESPGAYDGVVHLAAIPAPGITGNAATFANNAQATYNVFAAARAAGITNVVWASSETVLGLPFTTPPPYIPVDEDYPGRPESTYSLNKHLEEEMAAQFCRWNPALKMIGLRFSNVMEPADYAAFPAFDADPRLRSWNLWGYIDARDGAQAVRKSLELTATGRDIFIIANADTVMTRSSASLAAEVYPGVEVRKHLAEHETMLCIDKARRILGYEPDHSWRHHVKR
jgi:nucleoside-diphosphate-sugar epimerase